MGEFVHLHVHTEYSLLDGAARIGNLLDRAGELGMESLAITDHGVLYGVIDFYKKAKEKGIKPVIGCEVYVAARTRFDKEPHRDSSQYHLVLLAENEEGYRNLLALVSAASIEGFYYKPRVDHELLKKHSRGLIALSACLAGEIPSAILAGDYERAREVVLFYKNIFGENNFFLELQDQGIPEEQTVNSALAKLARETGIGLVATNDVHYTRKEDAEVHDVLLCIQTGKTVDDEDRMKFASDEFYLKSEQEMRELFKEFPEAIENTAKIAARCSVDFNFDQLHVPEFPLPKGHTEESYLRELVYQGAHKRFGEVLPQEVRERMEYELKIICDMGYAGYFLIVWDFINYAKKNNILVGPGRGSTAGCLISYVLEITEINPLRYNLLFERFLNPERASMPDIDVDFCYENRGRVIDYVVNKYGKERVAQIVTFGTMAARGAVRDVGRALNFSYNEVDRVAKMIPEQLGITIAAAIEQEPALKELYENDHRVRRLLDLSRAVEGLPRHTSVHAAGVVISKDPLTDHVPLQRTQDGNIVTQYSMELLAELGLLKMDFLGLRTLTVIGDALKLIREAYGKEIDINSIPLDDEKTYELLREGSTTGVFQLESSGMRSLLKELRPTVFEDIIAVVGLFRPGPLGSGMTDNFIQSKHGKKQIEYAHPALEPILKDTYGVLVYQEQVMQVVNTLANFSLGQAYLLIKAISKKKADIVKEQREAFIAGCGKNGIDKKTAKQIFDMILPFADYGFNKSHTTAYAFIAYQTAYLKANYPLEFMAALLTSVLNNTDKLTGYLEECRHIGIDVLPPDVNESGVDFIAKDGRIRFGLAAVKNVGRGVAESIVAARKEDGPFRSLQDFTNRISARQLNKRVIESLIKGSCFASLNVRRSQLLAVVGQCLERSQRIRRRQESGQLSFFDLYRDEAANPPEDDLPDLPEFPREKLLALEKEVLGLYLSGHPLEQYREVLAKLVDTTASELNEKSDNEQVVVGGMITAQNRITTRNGKPMAFITVEDLTGSFEAIVFPEVYKKSAPDLKEETTILIKGQTSAQDDDVKVVAGRIEPLSASRAFYIRISKAADRERLSVLKTILEEHRGNTPVYLYMEGQNKLVRVDRQYWVTVDEELTRRIQGLLGDRAVAVSYPES